MPRKNEVKVEVNPQPSDKEIAEDIAENVEADVREATDQPPPEVEPQP